MSSSTSDNHVATRASVIAGLAAATVGAFVLLGWILNIESFKTVYGPITMKANTAIGLLLAGFSLAILRRAPRLSMVFAVCAGLLGALTLSEHLVGWDLGIDQLLFTEAPGAAATASPNRMGLNACTTFMLAGTALCLLGRRSARAATAAQRIAGVALLLPAIPLAGYLYGAEQLYGFAQYTGIALHTALAFAALDVGLLLARANAGPVGAFLADGPAATILRRLALPVIGIPLALGYLETTLRSAGIVDDGLGMALYAVAVIVIIGTTIWLTAKVVDRSDKARRVAERHRDELVASERRARAEAERASLLKDHFIATLSHELRTPLNVMLGWTQLLEQRSNPEDHARMAGLVAKNGQLLARLVEDLLDVSRVTAGQLDISPAPTFLNTILQSSLEAIAPTANAKGIQIESHLDPAMPAIDADPQRLQQIAWNLLSNAVKFTGPGGRIVVRTAFGGDGATLTISDTGIGFDEAFASELFTPFRQADPSATREYGGLGLGLSIARHIAQLHGGSLTGSSPGIGQGATFTLTLPRMARPSTPIERGRDRRLAVGS